jgi:hypothetical protein
MTAWVFERSSLVIVGWSVHTLSENWNGKDTLWSDSI